MKVLLSAYACQPDHGSEPGIGWNWAIHLAEAGCEVHVLTGSRNRNAIDAYLQRNPVPNLSFHYVDVPCIDPSRGGAQRYCLWLYFSLREARRLSRTMAFDVAHHVSYGSVLLPSPLWRLGVPTIFGPVGGAQTSPPSLLGYLGKAGTRERIRTFVIHVSRRLRIYRARMRRMSIVLAANQDTFVHAESTGCRRVLLLCDTGLRSDYGADSSRRFIRSLPIRFLWVGRLLPRKGLPLALDALARANPNTELTLVGSGLDPEIVRRMIRERGLDGRVHWEGARLPWMQVREAYATHDALLFTSIRDSFGSQNLEAMSVGLPVISLRLGGARDFIPDAAGLKVEVGPTIRDTVNNFVDALNQFVNMSVEERNRMSEAAWRGAQEFSWTRRAEVARALYAEARAKP